MNIILNTYQNINGSLIDSIEYFLYLRTLNVDTTLVIQTQTTKSTKKIIIDLIKDRYICETYTNDILCVKSLDKFLIGNSYNTVMITDWSTFTNHHLIYNFNKLIIWYEHRDDKIYDEYKKFDELSDKIFIYKEMPYEYGIDYKFKFCFDFYKKINVSNKKTFLSTNTKIYTDKEIDLAREYATYELVLFNKHPKNFWESFTEYLYIESVYWDPRPRLFIEAKFYNKEIKYIRLTNKKDGAYYRSICNLDRNLTKNDEIIVKFQDHDKLIHDNL